MKKKYQVMSFLSLFIFLIGLASAQDSQHSVVDENGNLKMIEQNTITTTTTTPPVTTTPPAAATNNPAAAATPPSNTINPNVHQPQSNQTQSNTVPPTPNAAPQPAPNTVPIDQPATPSATTINQSSPTMREGH